MPGKRMTPATKKFERKEPMRSKMWPATNGLSVILTEKSAVPFPSVGEPWLILRQSYHLHILRMLHYKLVFDLLFGIGRKRKLPDDEFQLRVIPGLGLNMLDFDLDLLMLRDR